MQRRNFLKALAMAASLPFIAGHTDPVIAAPIPEHPYQKYIDALVLYDAVIAVSQQKPVDSITLHEKCDKLFTFMLANFIAPEYTPEIQAQANEIIDPPKGSQSQDERLRRVPPEIAEMLWPIAVAKALLFEHKIPMMCRRVPAWGSNDGFVARYYKLIMNS